MKKLFIVLAFLTIQFFFSQESKVDLKIKYKIENLKQNGSDTIVVYSENCVGCKPKIIRKDECFSDETKFIFWAKNDNYFMQKMDACNEYVEQKMDNSEFMKMGIKNPQLIESAKIKHVEHKINKKKTTSYLVDHYTYYDFEFYYKNKNFNKEIIDYELETKMINEKTPNDNYQFNQKSILKKLLDLVKKEIY